MSVVADLSLEHAAMENAIATAKGRILLIVMRGILHLEISLYNPGVAKQLLRELRNP